MPLGPWQGLKFPVEQVPLENGSVSVDVDHDGGVLGNILLVRHSGIRLIVVSKILLCKDVVPGR
jgi:hypothetical protein